MAATCPSDSPLLPAAQPRVLPHPDEQRQWHLEALAHAGRLSTMGQLVAAIAHEINQPLYAITNYAGACHNAMQPGRRVRERNCPIGSRKSKCRPAGLR